MTTQERPRPLPLTVDNLRNSVAQGLQGSELFWQQFDLFDIGLSGSTQEKGLFSHPYMTMRAEFHFRPNTPTPRIENGLVGNQMNRQIAETINAIWPGLFERWESGFSGGNSSGWDINFYGMLGQTAEQLHLPKDGDELVLVHYEKPKDEPRNRKSSGEVHTTTFNLEKDGTVIIGPDGVITEAELKKARKARLN